MEAIEGKLDESGNVLEPKLKAKIVLTQGSLTFPVSGVSLPPAPCQSVEASQRAVVSPAALATMVGTGSGLSSQSLPAPKRREQWCATCSGRNRRYERWRSVTTCSALCTQHEELGAALAQERERHCVAERHRDYCSDSELLDQRRETDKAKGDLWRASTVPGARDPSQELRTTVQRLQRQVAQLIANRTAVQARASREPSRAVNDQASLRAAQQGMSQMHMVLAAAIEGARASAVELAEDSRAAGEEVAAAKTSGTPMQLQTRCCPYLPLSDPAHIQAAPVADPHRSGAGPQGAGVAERWADGSAAVRGCDGEDAGRALLCASHHGHDSTGNSRPSATRRAGTVGSACLAVPVGRSPQPSATRPHCQRDLIRLCCRCQGAGCVAR